MTDVLAQIVAHKKIEVQRAREAVSEQELRARIQDEPLPRNFFGAVTKPKGRLRVIAEVKKASPSAGIIRPDFNPLTIAKAYYENGAAAISCLTDEKFFQGSLAYIRQIKHTVPLPVLRKDFIIDPYQVYEARAAGADAILLIAECLTDPQIKDLIDLSTHLKMTVLLEIHDVENVERVRPFVGRADALPVLLGINNRDLKSMTTDLGHTLRLLEMIQCPETLVSESGIRTHDDVKRLANAGIHRVLVGEHLMRQPDVGQALRQLIGLDEKP